MKKTRWIALLFPLLAGAPAQANLTGAAVMQRVQAQRACIRDYTVDIAIQVRMKKVHVPDAVLRVYHKTPDKTKIQALKGFAVMPKGATPLGDPFAVFTARCTASVAGRGQVAGRPVIRLRLKAKEDPAAGAMDAWIDSERWVVLRLRQQPTGGGQATVDLSYQHIQGRYWLPARTVAQMMFPSTNAPAGTVTTRFYNYRVNTGLPDSLFREKASRR